MEVQLLANRWKTPDGTILQSKHRHDYVSHEDANGKVYAIDGGIGGYTRIIGDISDLENLSLYSDDPFEEIREHFSRGGYGKNGDEPLQWTVLKDMSDEYLGGIIEFEESYRPKNPYLWVYLKEKEFRI